MKLLPTEDLEHLDIPVDDESITGPVKRLVYLEDNEKPNGGENTLSWQRTNATRFNLFTGNQTLDEREKSFKVLILNLSKENDEFLMLELQIDFFSCFVGYAYICMEIICAGGWNCCCALRFF